MGNKSQASIGVGDYALTLIDAVRWLASEVDKAGDAGLSISEAAARYRHFPKGDLARIRHHHGCKNDFEATEWVLNEAVRALGRDGKHLVIEDGRCVAVSFPEFPALLERGARAER